MKSKLINTLARAGYHKIENFPPVDFRGILDDPLAGLARNYGGPILIDIPVTKCRAMGPLAFPCSKNSDHPYIQTLLQLINKPDLTYEDSALRKYYDTVQPTTVAELLDIRGTPSQTFLEPPIAFNYPWIAAPIRSGIAKKTSYLAKENAKHGAALDWTHGWNLTGPVSSEKGQLELTRLSRCLSWISAKGYIRSNEPDGDICGHLLIRDSEWVVRLGSGQHRAATLAALGHTVLPIRIGSMKPVKVRREEAQSWPGVHAGGFNLQQATLVFDRIFEGKAPWTSQSQSSEGSAVQSAQEQ